MIPSGAAGHVLKFCQRIKFDVKWELLVRSSQLIVNCVRNKDKKVESVRIELLNSGGLKSSTHAPSKRIVSEVR